jgi:hypothetical protein
MTKGIVAFRNFANVPKNRPYISKHSKQHERLRYRLKDELHTAQLTHNVKKVQYVEP